MTFRDIIGRNDDDSVPWHEHDAADISGEGVYTELRVDSLLSGTIDSKEIIVSGGTDGILKSSNFSSGSAGWQILGDGSAEFNDVTVRGDLESGTSPELVTITDGKLTVKDGATQVVVDPATFASLGNPIIELYRDVSGSPTKRTEFYASSGATVLNAAGGTDLQLTASAIPTGGDVLLRPGGVTVAQATSQGLEATDGTSSGPAYSFINDTDTGMYRGGSGEISFAIGGSDVMDLFGSSWRPGSDNAISLGTGSFRFSEVFAAIGTINTSDARVKSDLHPYDPGHLVDSLVPYQYKRTDRDDGLWHFGFVAQEIADHLPPAEYAITHRPNTDDEWWGIRPDQLVPILWAEVQQLRARVGALEAA